MSNDSLTPRTVAIVAYLSIIGWLVAYIILYPKQRSSLGAFHLRQTLGLYLLGFVLSMISRASMGMGGIFGIIIFVLWLIGLISAAKGEEKPLPVIGEYFQRWFGNL